MVAASRRAWLASDGRRVFPQSSLNPPAERADTPRVLPLPRQLLVLVRECQCYSSIEDIRYQNVAKGLSELRS
ncbi:hypothetical protein RR48_06931 [Papilio machaon]|uniref:Uncharacterized protein n=1 Tax=Papilio machaon TaxID=76193 RepID=A0A194RAX7_PAPMA|nr:hypothetical protein RR48_06931 [Papilio machaon]